MTEQVRYRRRTRTQELRLCLVVLLAALAWAVLAPAHAHAASSITVRAHALSDGSLLPKFTYIVNVDNTSDPNDPNPLKRPSIAGTPSNSPIVAEGDQNDPTKSLPDGRYLISIRSPGHKMWGKHITLPADAGDVDISLRSGPFPLGKIRVFVFDDSHWTNGAPDNEEAGLAGFQVTLEEQTNSLVTVDYNNNPLCGGDCTTASDGFVQIDNMGPATYFVYVTPPAGGCGPNHDGTWVQTSTFDGGFGVQAGIEEGSDGSGAPGEGLYEPPNRRTGYWFGFVCTSTNTLSAGSGSVSGRALNWVGWPPFDVLTTDANEPVANAYVALTDSTDDTTKYVGQADGAGNFSIPNVPPGTYTLSIWDEQLSYIIRFLPVTVTASGPNQNVDLGDVGVSRWFGWLGGDVYIDSNNNGVRDCPDPTDLVNCERAVPNTDMDQRWRDGSIKESTFTDANGHYEYPTAEGGPLGKWIIGEQGFARFSAFPGPSVHNELNPSQVTPVPTDLGGGLLTNQLLTEGHRATVDWGKHVYPAGTPGQIVGITYYATTRNEFDAYLQAHEDYEPAIPNVTVNLEGLGPDGKPDTADDTLLNQYVTDHWSQPTGCDVTDNTGADISTILNPLIGPNCLEVPITGQETKDGAFDGGYAFADYCPDGFDVDAPDPDNASCWNAAHDGHVAKVPLVAGTYITHAMMPKDASDSRPCNPDNANGFKSISGPTGAAGETGCLYRPVREEDVNVDLGNQFIPAIPPPLCTGDDHVIDQSTLTSRSPYSGRSPSPTKPLCDKRLVVLNNQQNANADFFMMTNFDNGPDVAEPGRIVGLVSDDIYFDRNPKSIWYGEPRPVGHVPIGIRDYNYRLITTTETDSNGTYEALLPSTETFNCPIPQGPCPGMYLVVVNDPGDKAHPNASYNPNYLTASLGWDVWPGKTTQLDTPLDPISGTGCEPALTQPELLDVSTPVVLSGTSGASRRITIRGDAFGSAPGTVTLDDPRGPGQSRTLGPAVNPNPNGAGGIVSWANTQIVIQVPATGFAFPAGQKQLTIRRPGAGGLSSTNGITLHVLGNGYAPNVVQVGAPTSSAHALQNAIDAAPAGSILVLKPGVYQENVVLWKRLILQGVGPGGIIGFAELQQRQPDDPRFNIQGTTIDGRFFPDTTVNADWHSTVSGLGSLAGVDAAHPVLEGADVTVVAKGQNDYNIGTGPTNVFGAGRIDGIGLMTGHGQGTGGIQLQAYARNLQITNDILDSNSGVFGGGIGLGQPYDDAHNNNVAIRDNRIMGNGGIARSGGIGIFNGSDSYDIQRNVICSNFGVEYGAGVSHWGHSPNGKIRDNQIYYNDAVDSGAGISISQESPQALPDGTIPLGQGSGNVDVDRNLIEANYSGDDGGGIFVMNAHSDRINIRNNQLVDNGAADLGGALMLDDSVNVSIVNNTVANNVTTASTANSNQTPHAAGLVAETNSPQLQATLAPGAPSFSRPVALFNNIFWDNQAFTLSAPGPGAALVNRGFIDLEVHGTGSASDTFTPRYSLLTANSAIRGNGSTATLPPGQGNIFGANPAFAAPFVLQLTVAGSRMDPQVAAVTITNADPPVGLQGNYHITAGSAAIDRGAAYSNFPGARTGASILAPCSTGVSPQPFGADIDNQARPQLRSFRIMTPWDLGADELPGIPFPLLPWSCGGTT